MILNYIRNVYCWTKFWVVWGFRGLQETQIIRINSHIKLSDMCMENRQWQYETEEQRTQNSALWYSSCTLNAEIKPESHQAPEPRRRPHRIRPSCLQRWSRPCSAPPQRWIDLQHRPLWSRYWTQLHNNKNIVHTYIHNVNFEVHINSILQGSRRIMSVLWRK